MSEPRPDITGDQLAHARGCDPTNDCHRDCVWAASDDLVEWDDLNEWSRTRILELVPWVREQRWSP